MSELTQIDNSQPANERAVPRVSRQLKITLTGATIGSVQLPEDVKSALIVAKGADVQFWVSYNDGATDILPALATASNKTNAIAANVIKDVEKDASFYEIQEAEFNKINAVITTGSGAASVLVFPGSGMANNV